jgi:hypothetical protein
MAMVVRVASLWASVTELIKRTNAAAKTELVRLIFNASPNNPDETPEAVDFASIYRCVARGHCCRTRGRRQVFSLFGARMRLVQCRG